MMWQLFQLTQIQIHDMLFGHVASATEVKRIGFGAWQ